jgi:DNA-binding LacI/PurR family transcriptional regulator
MTQKAIARTLNISRGTVSLALNGSPLINKDTRARVLEAAKRLGYRPNLAARSMSTGKSMSVGIVLPSIAHPFNAAVVDGLQKQLLAADYVGLYYPSSGPDDYLQALEALIPRRIDGLIAVATAPELIALLRQEHVPAVYYSAGCDEVDEVTLDAARSGNLAASHLADLGHTRIGFIGPTGETAGRFHSFAEALKNCGIPLRREYVRDLVPGFGQASAQQGHQAMAALLRKNPRPTAIFTHNDLLAFGAMRAVHEAGLSVPRDVSIVGHDDTCEAGYLPVSLTSIHLPVEQIAQELVRLMLARIAQGDVSSGKPERVVVEPTLVVRESTERARQQTRKG